MSMFARYESVSEGGWVRVRVKIWGLRRVTYDMVGLHRRTNSTMEMVLGSRSGCNSAMIFFSSSMRRRAKLRSRKPGSSSVSSDRNAFAVVSQRPRWRASSSGGMSATWNGAGIWTEGFRTPEAVSRWRVAILFWERAS